MIQATPMSLIPRTRLLFFVVAAFGMTFGPEVVAAQPPRVFQLRGAYWEVDKDRDSVLNVWNGDDAEAVVLQGELILGDGTWISIPETELAPLETRRIPIAPLLAGSNAGTANRLHTGAIRIHYTSPTGTASLLASVGVLHEKNGISSSIPLVYELGISSGTLVTSWWRPRGLKRAVLAVLNPVQVPLTFRPVLNGLFPVFR